MSIDYCNLKGFPKGSEPPCCCWRIDHHYLQFACNFHMFSLLQQQQQQQNNVTPTTALIIFLVHVQVHCRHTFNLDSIFLAFFFAFVWELRWTETQIQNEYLPEKLAILHDYHHCSLKLMMAPCAISLKMIHLRIGYWRMGHWQMVFWQMVTADQMFHIISISAHIKWQYHALFEKNGRSREFSCV